MKNSTNRTTIARQAMRFAEDDTTCSVKVAPPRKPRIGSGFRLCFYREIFHHVPAEWISRFSRT